MARGDIRRVARGEDDDDGPKVSSGGKH